MDMKKWLLLWLTLVVGVTAFGQVMAPDSSYVTIPTDGKPLQIPLVGRDDHGCFYALQTNFMEHGRKILYREYSYYKCDTCRDYRLDVSSYFVRPKGQKDYRQYLHSLISWYGSDRDHDDYYAEVYGNLKKVCPVLEKQSLGKMSRLWYPVMKYQGQYYLTIDNLTVIELNDSLVLYYDMELSICALRNFQKEGKDCYSWQEVSEYWEGTAQVTVRPDPQIKGLYEIIRTYPDGIVGTGHYTPEENVHLFDLIDWESTDHIPTDLDGMEK